MIIETNRAIQDQYGQRFRHCWGCGPANPFGLHLKSYPTKEGRGCVAKIQPGPTYTGGVPDKLFGGMIAALFDCHGTASAAWFAHHNKGLDFTSETLIQRFITARLEVDYKKPVPIDREITIHSYLEELTERKACIRMDMQVAEEVLAQARIVAVASRDSL